VLPACGSAGAPVGIIWSVLEFTGYGPSAILEHTEKSIQYNRAARRAYEQTAEVSRESARRINEQLPGLQVKSRALEANLDKLKATQENELKHLNAQIQSYQHQIPQQKRELRHWQAMEREANE
jgi:Spy/CpxP family protein refolding chaperone